MSPRPQQRRYTITVVDRNLRVVERFTTQLDLTQTEATHQKLLQLLADAVRRDDQRLDRVPWYGLQVRESGNRRLAMPLFRATHAEVKDLP